MAFAVKRSKRPCGPVQLELSDDQRLAAYTAYYGALARLREGFHSTGRFDDANAKLDEIVKLLAIRIREARRTATGGTDRFTRDYLAELAEQRFGDRRQNARALLALAEEVLNDPGFRNPDATSIFGSQPTLNIQPTDDDFARRIVQEVRVLSPHLVSASDTLLEQFDVLNESFGHFVRDSFHQTKEDAQYMTPPEVVSAMTEMAVADIESDREELRGGLNASGRDPYVILDPTCGVGSFLVQALRRILRMAESAGINGHDLASLASRLRDCCVCGQDKVDRMVRLAKVNLSLFGRGGASVWQGNSILGPSPLDSLQGRVDIILTNPPFGAEYDVGDVLRNNPPEHYPMLRELRATGRIPQRLNSEIMLLDRCLSFLRPGGRLVIVLPDKVISAKGVEAVVREWVSRRAQLKAVVQLPAVTFAQAGTRTRTCFVYLQKRAASHHGPGDTRTFMAVCEDLGYQVVERGGIPVKVPTGTNQLCEISKVYAHTSAAGAGKDDPYLVANQAPSAVWVRGDAFINGRWTPSFHHVQRLGAVSQLERLKDAGFEVRRLNSIVRLCSKERRMERPAAGARVISVLHVATNGTIDLKEVAEYDPKTPGLSCEPGEVLFSKINPRIPRVCVVPRLDFPVACSTEFEVLHPLDDLDPYLLAALLMSAPVQEQVQHLTSGTSSSHNRIKDSELAEILVPLPRRDSAAAGEFAEIAESLRCSMEKRYEADQGLSAKLRQVASLLASPSKEISPASVAAT